MILIKRDIAGIRYGLTTNPGMAGVACTFRVDQYDFEDVPGGDLGFLFAFELGIWITSIRVFMEI